MRSLSSNAFLGHSGASNTPANEQENEQIQRRGILSFLWRRYCWQASNCSRRAAKLSSRHFGLRGRFKYSSRRIRIDMRMNRTAANSP